MKIKTKADYSENGFWGMQFSEFRESNRYRMAEKKYEFVKCQYNGCVNDATHSNANSFVICSEHAKTDPSNYLGKKVILEWAKKNNLK